LGRSDTLAREVWVRLFPRRASGTPGLPMIRKLAVLPCVMMLLVVCQAEAGKVESLGPLTDAMVPEAVRKVLDTKGYRVVLPDGSMAAELWLRKDVPARTGRGDPDALYPQLAESTLIGVLRFPQASTDYRGQPIPSGFYTLRYEMMPNDGNHLGAAPSRDFVLLIPAGSDPDPNAVFTFPDLVALSRKATSTKHAGPLNLTAASGGIPPSVSKDDQDHFIFFAILKLASGEDLSFGLVVKGTAPQ